MASGTIKTGWNLVWTNPNPSANFASQTISLNLSQYSEIMVQAATNANNLFVNDYIVLLDGEQKMMLSMINLESIDSIQVISRAFTPSSTNIIFRDGYDKAINSSTGTVNNIRQRPLYIYAR